MLVITCGKKRERSIKPNRYVMASVIYDSYYCEKRKNDCLGSYSTSNQPPIIIELPHIYLPIRTNQKVNLLLLLQCLTLNTKLQPARIFDPFHHYVSYPFTWYVYIFRLSHKSKRSAEVGKHGLFAVVIFPPSGRKRRKQSGLRRSNHDSPPHHVLEVRRKSGLWTKLANIKTLHWLSLIINNMAVALRRYDIIIEYT